MCMTVISPGFLINSTIWAILIPVKISKRYTAAMAFFIRYFCLTSNRESPWDWGFFSINEQCFYCCIETVWLLLAFLLEEESNTCINTSTRFPVHFHSDCIYKSPIISILACPCFALSRLKPQGKCINIKKELLNRKLVNIDMKVNKVHPRRLTAFLFREIGY